MLISGEIYENCAAANADAVPVGSGDGVRMMKPSGIDGNGAVVIMRIEY